MLMLNADVNLGLFKTSKMSTLEHELRNGVASLQYIRGFGQPAPNFAKLM